MSTFALDVADYDAWESGSLGMESLDYGQLARDVIYEETAIREAGEAGERVADEGWALPELKKILFGAASGFTVAAGFIPKGALKAGLGGARALSQVGSYGLAERLASADEVAAALRGMSSQSRSALNLSADSLRAGVDNAVRELGYADDVLGEVPAGGFTWNPRTNQFDFTEGYSSGISPLHTVTVKVGDFTGADLVGFLNHKGFGERTVAQLLAKDPAKMIGGWIEDGLVYLDVSKIFGDRAEALRVAQRLGEYSVWDIAKGKPINLDRAKRPSPFARAAAAGGAEADDTLLAQMRADGLEDFFTGKVDGAELRPELTPIFFSDMTTGQKQFLAKELLKEAPARKYTADDFDNPVLSEWVKREQEYLKGLGGRATSSLGRRRFTRRVRGEDGEWLKTVNDKGEEVDLKISKIIEDRTSAPKVSFLEEFGLEQVPLSSGKSIMMHRKITKAILKGDVRAVAEVLAVQSNNLARFIGKDALTPNFYPYMAYMTISNAKKTHPALLAPMLATSSAQVGPGGESGRALRSMGKLLENKRYDKDKKLVGKYYSIQNGQAVWEGGKGSGYDVNVMKATLAMVNNPDWIMNPVTGLSVKTYVYALLKLNPKLSRALVVDTVDIQMRFATRMSPGWDTTKAGEMTEIALNQMVTRAMARSMGVPAFSLQENGWGTFRAIRDRFAGTPKSLTFRNQPLGAVYSQIALPPDLAALYKRNYEKLLREVRAGRAPHWQEMTKGVLVPSDNLPVEMLLPPLVRAKPDYVQRFKDMIATADNLGDALRGAA